MTFVMSVSDVLRNLFITAGVKYPISTRLCGIGNTHFMGSHWGFPEVARVRAASMKKIRLMLVDDHEVARARLRTFLLTQSDIDVVAEAPDGEDAIRMAPAAHPEIILMDISIPGMDSLE